MSQHELYEAVIGLECHVQLNTQSKLFGTASTAFGATPNSLTDAYNLALPGTLPVLNLRAIEQAMTMGLACECTIALESEFSRKHYFYPDLPKGYQISQHDRPLCLGGHVTFTLHGNRHQIRLNRIHVEEDAGKNVHLPATYVSLVDLNRAGVPLIEIVSEPDIRSAEEAAEYLRAIRKLVRFLGISDGNMEEGSLRCDANVSIRKKGATALGTKTELKNINSFKFVQKAIEHEIDRQITIVSQGGTIVSETRGWDAEKGTSHSQRKKEQASDYRFFPEPDLPPLRIDPAWLDRVRSGLPETPLQRRDRYIETWALTDYDADVLTAEKELGDFFDRTVSLTLRPSLDPPVVAKTASNWIGSELLGALNRDGKTIVDSPVSPETLSELLVLLLQDTINGKTAKDIFAQVYASGGSPADMVAKQGLGQISDPASVEQVCRSVLSDPALAKQIEKFRAGNDRLLGFFVGLVMKETQGRAKPELVNECVRRILQEGG